VADEVDNANDMSEMLLQNAIKQKSLLFVTEPTGYCFNCEEPVEGSKKFCNSECCEDWEYRQRRK
jgi:hypothetical protein